MKVITFANNKGGSAKTTTTTTVAHGLSLIFQNSGMNEKILVVDTDSQAHSTLLLTGRKDHPEEKTLASVIWKQSQKEDVRQALKRAIIPSTWDENIHVLPASTSLDAIEENMVGRSGNVFFLKRVLQLIQDEYAVILIDTCPKFSLLTKMALMASDDVIIPVAPQYLDADGLMSIINKVHDERELWESSSPNVTGIIIVKFHVNINGHKAIENAIIENEVTGSMYLGTIPLNADIEYSHANQMSVFQYNARSTGAAAYATVIRNIANKVFVGA